jgi:hypothetical protein
LDGLHLRRSWERGGGGGGLLSCRRGFDVDIFMFLTLLTERGVPEKGFRVFLRISKQGETTVEHRRIL